MKSTSRRASHQRRATQAPPRPRVLISPKPMALTVSALGQLMAHAADASSAPNEPAATAVVETQVATTPSPAIAKPVEFPELHDSAKDSMSLPMTPLMDVNLRISVVLGETSLTLGELLKLGEGSVIELNNSTGEPINIYVNDRLYAKGDIVVVDDMFGVRLSEVLDSPKKG